MSATEPLLIPHADADGSLCGYLRVCERDFALRIVPACPPTPARLDGCRALQSTLAGHEARVWSIVATPERIFSCSADKTIVVWSMADARRGVATQLARIATHTAMGPTERAACEGILEIMDLSDGKIKLVKSFRQNYKMKDFVYISK